MARKDRMMMKEHLNKAADKGRKGDTYLAHMTGGELVLPKEFASDPQIRALIDAKFKSYGESSDKYVVGNKENSINPETGQPEFGFLKKFAGTIIGATIGYLTGGPAAAAAAVTGAKIGATVDATRAISDAQSQAKAQAAQAQAVALQQAQLAREAASSEAQRSRDAAAEQAKLTRAQQAEILAQQSKSTQDQIDAQRAGAASSLEQARLTAAQQAEMLRNLTIQQTAAADAAKAQLYQQQKQYEEQKFAMEKQAKDQAAALDAERRKIAQRESAQMTARRRAGKRSLLSSARMNPELGIPSGVDETQMKTMLGA